MNRDVNVTKRIKTPQDLRHCPVVLSANGRIRPDWVVVNGGEERHPEGSYYLEWREGATGNVGRRRRPRLLFHQSTFAGRLVH